MENNKFYMPEILTIAQTIICNLDDIDDLSKYLNILLDYLDINDEKDTCQNKMLYITLILLLEKISTIEKRNEILYNSFPDMPLDQWDIFQNRFDEFISKMTDLKLNN